MKRLVPALVLLGLLASLTGCKIPRDYIPRPVIIAMDVPLTTVWKLDLPAGKTAADVEGVSIAGKEGFPPVAMQRAGNRLDLTPYFPYDRNTTYTVRVFFKDATRYEGSITTEDFPKLSHGEIVQVPAAPARGFYYPYFLYLPKVMDDSAAHRLLVEASNTEISDDLIDHRERARSYLSPQGNTRIIADDLQIPALVPVFPRVVNGVATHNLSRDTMLVPDGPLQRVDLQLAAMIRDARQVLEHGGVRTEDQVLLYGFATASHFTDTFAKLHPELVRAVVSAGVGGTLTYPGAAYQGRTLPYPAGLADIREITGADFDLAAYRQVAQLITMGELEKRDPVADLLVYAPRDAALIRNTFGTNLIPDRWERFQTAYKELGIPAQFITYPGLGQQPGPVEDVIAFFRANQGAGGGLTAITPVHP